MTVPTRTDGERRGVGRAVAAHAGVAVLVIAALAVLGAGAGFLWHLVAPRAEYVLKDGARAFTESVPTEPIAADGWFALIALAAGVLTGSLAQGVFHRRLLGAVVGLAVGGALAALVAWQVGHWFGAAEYQEAIRSARDGTKVLAPLDVRAKGVLTLWPLAATLTVFLGMLIEELQRLLTRPREPGAPPPPRELPPIREEGNHTSSYPYAGPAGEQGSAAP